jgi:ribosomal silencing factor RsfS
VREFYQLEKMWQPSLADAKNVWLWLDKHAYLYLRRWET